MTLAVPEIQNTCSPAGKYLTFVLGRGSYGISVLKVREIIRLVEITSVPQMPPYVAGVINLRGKVVPVVDLRLRFSLPAEASTQRTCIVVVQIKNATGGFALTGVIVDAVEEVISIAAQEIDPAPYLGPALDTSCLLGLARIKSQVKTLLDIDRVLAAETLEHIAQATQAT